MDITIAWRQDYEFLETADIKSKRTKLEKPIWHQFDVEDILWHSRDYAVNLLSMGTPVVVKEGEVYLVNKTDLFNQYRSAGKWVKMLSDCEPSTESVERVGFGGCL